MLQEAEVMAGETKAEGLLNISNCECSKHLDVRVLVGDDQLLEGGILAALEEYNTEELATVEVPGIDGKVGPNISAPYVATSPTQLPVEAKDSRDLLGVLFCLPR